MPKRAARGKPADSFTSEVTQEAKSDRLAGSTTPPDANVTTIRDMLAGWDSVRGTQDLHSYLEQQLVRWEACATVDEAKRTVREISDTIAEVETSCADLQTWKEQGGTREGWLESEIQKVARTAMLESRSLAHTVAQSLDRANADLLGVPTADGTGGAVGDSGLGLKVTVQSIGLALKANTGIYLQKGFERGLGADAPDLVEQAAQSPAAAAALYSALGSREEQEVKQIIAVGMVVANNRGWIPGWEGATPADFALVADRSIDATKVTVKVACGEIGLEQAIEYLIDRSCAVLREAIVIAATKVGGAVGEALGRIIGGIFGPAGAYIGGEVGRLVGAKAGGWVGERIADVVDKVAGRVKDLVRDCTSAVASAAKSLWDVVCFWF